MPKNSKKPVAQDPFETLCKMGDRLRATFGEVRHVNMTVHNGVEWTVVDRWERLDAESMCWVEINWNEFQG